MQISRIALLFKRKPSQKKLRIPTQRQQTIMNPQIPSELNIYQKSLGIKDSYLKLKAKTKDIVHSSSDKLISKYSDTKETLKNITSIGKFLVESIKTTVTKKAKSTYKDVTEECKDVYSSLKEFYTITKSDSQRLINRNYTKLIKNETDNATKTPSIMQKIGELTFFGLNKALKKTGKEIISLPKTMDSVIDDLFFSLIHLIFPKRVTPDIYRPAIVTTSTDSGSRSFNFLHPTTGMTTKLIKNDDGSLEKELNKGKSCRIRCILQEDKATGKAILTQTFYHISNKPVTIKKEAELKNLRLNGFLLMNYMSNLINADEIRRVAYA